MGNYDYFCETFLKFENYVNAFATQSSPLQFDPEARVEISELEADDSLNKEYFEKNYIERDYKGKMNGGIG